MKKPIKKTWMIASALTIGMAVLTPLQAGAASAEKTIEASVQKEQQIKGTIKNIFFDGMNLKGKDGKKYFISFNNFSAEQLEKMNLVEGQEIAVEGSVVEYYNDFDTFEAYKKDLPKEVTKEDLTTLEKLFSEIKKLQKELNEDKKASDEEIEKKFEEMDKIYDEMYKIKKPYVLANWQPQSFDEFIEDYGFSESNIVIKENDKTQLKAIYEELVKLEKSGDEEKANKKYEEFFKILKPYVDELYPPRTFEESLEGLESEIPAETLAKLKTIFEDARKADKDENEELSNKLWNEFYEILDQFYKPSTFEEYMADFDFEVSEADSKQLKQLYEESLALNKKEELEKAEEKWDAFYKILDPYIKANEEILISASKLTINGQEYFPQH
ncbi:hypothetical protein [Lysinibacillus sphaericus]|uniref:Uncharacterized protein n=1 Tax=Lysinibacillus sphaericus OT4b.31 TaxID=1285586 RepID=R7ZDJ2_LYSSH|nr:hypothetical protein [Lysinibacillus sphaericus]EON72215.1 hypothetical protein H131_11578 [Lysinibacillus sphaericus OT4b.31]